MIYSTKICGDFGTILSPTGKLKKKRYFRCTTFPSRTSLKLVKSIVPIEIAIYFAVARVGEFVRDNAS